MATIQKFEADHDLNYAEEILKDLTPSAKKVFVAIRNRGPLGVKDIEQITFYSPRAVRYALAQLRELELIIQIKDIRDTRRNFYSVSQNMSYY